MSDAAIDRIRRIIVGRDSHIDIYREQIRQSVHPLFCAEPEQMRMLIESRYCQDLEVVAGLYFELLQRQERQRERRGDA